VVAGDMVETGQDRHGHAAPMRYCWSMIFSENRHPLFGIML
jgi:hypothetical protein